jgi:hypothetical protein
MASKAKNPNNAKLCELADNAVEPKLYGVINRYSEFLNLLSNAIGIDGIDNYRQLKKVKRLLLTIGKVGYDGITKKWYAISPCGKLNEDGDYLKARFMPSNGSKGFFRELSYEPEHEGAYLIDALPTDGITMSDLIREACDFMEQADMCARQNLEANKTPFVAVCKDEQTRLSLEQAVQQKTMGQAAIIVSPELGDALKGVSFQTNFIADKALDLRDRERDTLLNKLGVLTANQEKKERVQSTEVNAKLGECTDYIYLLIDTFNAQMEAYGLPFTMYYNGSMEELYEDGDPTAVTDQEKDQNVNMEEKQNG